MLLSLGVRRAGALVAAGATAAGRPRWLATAAVQAPEVPVEGAGNPRVITFGSGGIDMTAAAEQRLELIRAKDASLALRVFVEGGGCHGFKFRMELQPFKVAEDDVVIQKGALRIVTDDMSLEKLRGAVIDYKATMMSSSFSVVFDTSKTQSCGCGSSFTPK